MARAGRASGDGRAAAAGASALRAPAGAAFIALGEAEAALDQRLAARRRFAGFVDLVGERRLLLAALLLLQPHDVLVFVLSGAGRSSPPRKWMRNSMS